MSNRYRISLLDAVVLLYHVHRGAQHPEVGFEDADKTLKQLTKSLAQFRYTITESSLESALWSCNLMDEVGEFWSPQGLSFKDWTNRLLSEQGADFDHFYNVIDERKNGTKA